MQRWTRRRRGLDSICVPRRDAHAAFRKKLFFLSLFLLAFSCIFPGRPVKKVSRGSFVACSSSSISQGIVHRALLTIAFLPSQLSHLESFREAHTLFPPPSSRSDRAQNNVLREGHVQRDMIRSRATAEISRSPASQISSSRAEHLDSCIATNPAPRERVRTPLARVTSLVSQRWNPTAAQSHSAEGTAKIMRN